MAIGRKGRLEPVPHGRIAKHGLHVWLGSYKNASALLRECYAELCRATTDPAAPILTWEQALIPADNLKQDQVNASNQAIADCDSSSSCGHISEIMLVGFSQGGIDAQNLAFRSDPSMGWDNSLVTAVVTFGAPITRPSPPGVATIHLQDWFDPVPNTFNFGPLAYLAD
jgi:uncharacterized protein with NAD-binding domain and iron-sulfur cluster